MASKQFLLNTVQHILIFIFFIACFFLGSFFYIIHYQRIDFSALEHYNPGKPSLVLDDEGHEWTRFALDRREPINLQKAPQHLLDAFIAAEDHYFWSHYGISVRGIFRSLLINCYHGRIVQGASTITQQLVKLLFFDARKTYGRKLKEQIYALLVELQFSKDHILQTYMNHVYFGCGIYGVEAAAQRFWGKSACELSIDQAAMLAAIVKSPGQYCPLLYPLSARKRRDVVLSSMYSLGSISYEDYLQAKEAPLELIEYGGDTIAPHLKETLRVFLESLCGREQLYTGGLTIQTTINRSLQLHAQEVFKMQLEELKKTIHPAVDGSLLCMKTKTGEIKALIGGYDFTQSQFNRALQAKRQFGSIFKTFVYAAALQEGKHFAQTALDEPIAIGNDNVWQPQNNTRQYEGEMTLARALSHSNNIITIKTLLQIGVDKVVALAKKLRLSGEILSYPSLALGCIDGTLKEAVGMFNIFANHGMYVEPHYLLWVKDSLGTKIWKKRVDSERILSNFVTSQVTKVLAIGMSRIKNRYENSWIDAEAIGKTGTTNECRTNWFCGSTPEYTTGLYIGTDDNRSMGKHIYAVRTAFPIWLNLYRNICNGTKNFTYDPQLKEIFIDNRTGKRVAAKNSPRIFPILIPEEFA
ncbi:MAG: transglycosylase domain-containing protein [Candidatus Babeliales bacterium]